MFKFDKINDSGQKGEDNGVSRRDFFKITSALGSFAFIDPKKAFADLIDILEFEGKSRLEAKIYNDGIKEIYKDVFDKNEEIRKYYFEANKEFKVGGFFCS